MLYWLMTIAPQADDREFEYFNNLIGEGKPNVIGMNDTQESAPTGHRLFVGEMQTTDRIIVYNGVNEVYGILDVSSDSRPTSDAEKQEYLWFDDQRNVTLVHKFDPPFKSIVHPGQGRIIRVDTDLTRSFVTEVIGAIDDDAFTIDWGLMVSVH
jgi:hypothetical protein